MISIRGKIISSRKEMVFPRAQMISPCEEAVSPYGEVISSRAQMVSSKGELKKLSEAMGSFRGSAPNEGEAASDRVGQICRAIMFHSPSAGFSAIKSAIIWSALKTVM